MHCVAYGCNNSAKSGTTPPLSFHKFPSNEEVRLKWIKAVRRKDWTPSRHSKICSKHFTEHDFDRSSPFRVYLKPGSVPTVFTAFPAHLQKKQAEKLSKELAKKEQVEKENVLNELKYKCTVAEASFKEVSRKLVERGIKLQEANLQIKNLKKQIKKLTNKIHSYDITVEELRARAVVAEEYVKILEDLPK